MPEIQPTPQDIILKKQTIFFFGGLLPQFLLLFIITHLLQYPLFPLDTQLMRWTHQFTNPIFDHAAITLSYLGGMPAAIVFMLLLVGYSFFRKTKNILFILISVIGATSISWLLKVSVDRPRPMLWPRLVRDYGASFPSGHSVYAAAFAGLLIVMCWRTKWRFVISGVMLAWMFGMGMSRVYLGVHYPSDVLAGWALGWGWVFLVCLILNDKKLA